MDRSTSDLQLLAARIEILEKQNRLLKRIGLVLFLIPSCLALMGQARTSRTMQAERFVLKDASGRVRANLGVTEDGNPDFRLYDPNGKDRVAMGTDEKIGAFFMLSDPDSKAAYIVYLETLWGPKVGLQSASGKSSVDLTTAGPGLRIVDEAGYSAVLGTSDLVMKNTGEKRTTSAASLKLFDKDHKVIWSAP